MPFKSLGNVHRLSSRLFFSQKPFGQPVEGLLCLNSRHFSHTEPSSNYNDLEQGYSCEFVVTQASICFCDGSKTTIRSSPPPAAVKILRIEACSFLFATVGLLFNEAGRKFISEMGDLTRILCDIEKGDQYAANQLLPLVYDDLRKLAARKVASEKPGQTLQATALVHEAYLRLIGPGDKPTWEGRRHFFAAAAEAMRRILIEKARRKQGLSKVANSTGLMSISTRSPSMEHRSTCLPWTKR